MRKKTIVTCFSFKIFEFYELCIHGTFISSMASLFLAKNNPFLATIMSFSILSVAFVSRLLGTIVLDNMKDDKSRKEVLLLNMFLMGNVSFFMGCLPTYAYIGILAPTFLLIFTIIQGICIERRYNWTEIFLLEGRPIEIGYRLRKVLGTSGILGFLTASFLSVIVLYSYSEVTWIWRVPFWMVGLTGGFGFYLRISFSKNRLFFLRKKSSNILNLHNL